MRNIIVNGKEHTVTGNTVSFEEIVHLALGCDDIPAGLTIDYQLLNAGGSISAGETMPVEDGTTFNVTNAVTI